MGPSTSDAAVDPVEHLLDLFLYAPLGLLSKGAESFPDLVQRGRASSTNARVIGQFALGATNAKARTAIADAEHHIAAFLRIVADSAAPSARSSTAATTTDTDDDAAGSESMPIAGYEDLTAAEIIPLLAALSAEELQQVADYESAHRGRRTILNRINQLQR